MEQIKSFEELESKHWGGERYYRDPFLGLIFTEGIRDFMDTYGAAWLITEMMIQDKIRKSKYQAYPAIVVDKDHMVHCFFDCDHTKLGKDKPLFSIKDMLHKLPEGKLNFEFSPYEQILILMSEH